MSKKARPQSLCLDFRLITNSLFSNPQNANTSPALRLYHRCQRSHTHPTLLHPHASHTTSRPHLPHTHTHHRFQNFLTCITNPGYTRIERFRRWWKKGHHGVFLCYCPNYIYDSSGRTCARYNIACMLEEVLAVQWRI